MIEISIVNVIISLALHVLSLSIILTLILIGVIQKMMTREELEEFINELLEEEKEVEDFEREIDLRFP